MSEALDWKPFFYGGIASIVAEFCTFPIDTTKTRLQIQGQKMGNHAIRYGGMFHAFWKISYEEGFRSLYSGIYAAVLRQATYGTAKIGLYHSIKRVFVKNPKDEKLFTNVISGVSAGVVSSTIFNPTDVLKVRQQAVGCKCSSSYKSLYCVFIDIYRKEGVRGLWRGVGPTAHRAALVAGVELPAYDYIKKFIISRRFMDDNKYLHFLASFIAGVLGAFASNPVDVVKTRMMNQRKLLALSRTVVGDAISPAVYSSAKQCLVLTVHHEGVLALWRGFVPNWLRLGPHCIFFFMTYEQLKKLGDNLMSKH